MSRRRQSEVGGSKAFNGKRGVEETCVMQQQLGAARMCHEISVMLMRQAIEIKTCRNWYCEICLRGSQVDSLVSLLVDLLVAWLVC